MHQDKVLMGEAIPTLVEGDTILVQSMKALIVLVVRSKYSANPAPPRKPSAKRPPFAPIKEIPAAEGPCSEPEAE